MLKRVIAVLLCSAATVLAQPAPEGILILAHGGAADWNERVQALAATLSASQPVEVAFGMASRTTIQSAVDKLVTRGATSIVAVPMFVSSHSSVVTSTEYLLKARQEMPPELKIFARMNHGSPAASAANHEGHAGHAAAAPAVDNTQPVASPVPIRVTAALNHHHLVGEILIDRAREISTAPAQEAVIILAHGPVSDEENARWLGDMKVLATQMDDATAFAAIDYMTVRDDAPKPIRDSATADLRQRVEREIKQGRRVLIVPLLLSYGGIEKGIRQRLDGLDYVMAERALVPDDRMIEWVKRSVAK